MKKVRKLFALIFVLMLGIQTLRGGAAVWSANPDDGDWNNASNWMPPIVPNSAASTAAFAISNWTDISFSADTEVNRIVFNPGASNFTINVDAALVLTISGLGITNNSGITQNLTSAGEADGPGRIIFTNNATAGSSTAISNTVEFTGGFSSGETDFYNSSSAGDATITNGPYGGITHFFNSSSASSATITNRGPHFLGSPSEADTMFSDSSSAGSATIINNGTSAFGAYGGSTIFAGTSSAGSAFIINEDALAPNSWGGTTSFFDDSTGGTARVKVVGLGYLDITAHNPPGLTIGSIEGSGGVILDGNNLTVGSNNLSTSFSGRIGDAGTNGSFTKIGSGILTFEGGGSFNDYIGETITLSIAGGSVINLNYTGTPDKVAGLIVDGVAQPLGFYGSVASGAPHQLPVFAGTGLIQVMPPGPPVIASPLIAVGTIGQLFIYQFEAIGATHIDVNGLPPGMAFGQYMKIIVGNPTATGTFDVGLSASNTAGTTQATLTITIQDVPPAGPVIISNNLAAGRFGQPFLFRVLTRGGTPAATLSTNGLPPGLVIDGVPGVTGLISGVSAADGSFAVILTVTDGPFTTSSTLQLTFTADAARPVIVSPSTATLTPGQFFSYTIVAPTSVGSLDPNYFGYQGTLPPGLTFNGATGTISGTYNPPSQITDKGSGPDLAGGELLGSIQLFAKNGHGVSSLPLRFLSGSGIENISTRVLVGRGDNVLIGGFIITGNAPELVLIRAIGPSLTGFPDALQDPVLELHDTSGHVVVNDNWKDTQQDLITATTLVPTDDRESAILMGLNPGNYTTIVAGKNGTTGTALVEVYDLGTGSLDTSGSAELANVSTRGFVGAGDDVLIGGFIVHSQTTRVIARAIGPSLTALGIAGALQDTVLELRDGSGSLILANDDWRSTQEQEIIATGIPPSDNRESAIVENLIPGNYTAIVRGKNNTAGVALVEVYSL